MKNNKGVTAVEYGLIGALISIAIIGSVAMTGTDTKEVFCTVASGMETALGGSGENCDSSGTPEISKYVDSSMLSTDEGGTSTYSNSTGVWHSEFVKMIKQSLNNINASDPITNLYGVYNSSTHEAITDVSDLESANGISTASSNGNDPTSTTMMQVETQSGKVYNVSGMYYSRQQNPQGSSTNTNDAFQIDITDASTGQVADSLFENGGGYGSVTDSGFTP